eukprot:SAG31_NODE_1_length_62978_cov_30.836130_5_plen_118_part_00
MRQADCLFFTLFYLAPSLVSNDSIKIPQYISEVFGQFKRHVAAAERARVPQPGCEMIHLDLLEILFSSSVPNLLRSSIYMYDVVTIKFTKDVPTSKKMYMYLNLVLDKFSTTSRILR